MPQMNPLVIFTGNQKESDKKLANVVATSTRSGFKTFLLGLFRRPTGVTRKQLSADRDAVVGVLHHEDRCGVLGPREEVLAGHRPRELLGMEFAVEE